MTPCTDPDGFPCMYVVVTTSLTVVVQVEGPVTPTGGGAQFPVVDVAQVWSEFESAEDWASPFHQQDSMK